MTSIVHPDDPHYLALQRIIRTATDQAQAAWRELDGAAADSAASATLRLQIVATVEKAQAEAAALAPLYIAATLAALGAVSNPIGALVSAMFSGIAASCLPSRHTLDQHHDGLIDPRTPGPVRAGPLLCDQALMPPQHDARRRQPRCCVRG